MERSNFICCLVGFLTAKHPNISGKDLRIIIDQRLLESQLGIIGSESNDENLFQDLLDETIFSVMGRGINRDQRRSVMLK